MLKVLHLSKGWRVIGSLFHPWQHLAHILQCVPTPESVKYYVQNIYIIGDVIGLRI